MTPQIAEYRRNRSTFSTNFRREKKKKQKGRRKLIHKHFVAKMRQKWRILPANKPTNAFLRNHRKIRILDDSAPRFCRFVVENKDPTSTIVSRTPACAPPDVAGWARAGARPPSNISIVLLAHAAIRARKAARHAHSATRRVNTPGATRCGT